MISIRTDRLGNFIRVQHKAMGGSYRLHQDDAPKLGTSAKVAVYTTDNDEYEAPSKEHPHGLYKAEVKYFIGSYIEPVPTTPAEPVPTIEAAEAALAPELVSVPA